MATEGCKRVLDEDVRVSLLDSHGVVRVGVRIAVN